MKHLSMLITGFSLLTIVSCKKGGDDAGQGKDLELTQTEQQLAEADNTFSLKLFKEVAEEETGGKNIFISPLSVSMALSMTSNGSKGETLQEMRTALEHTDFSDEQINQYYRKLITELPQLDPKTTLSIANSIWFRNTFSVLPDFLQVNSDYYNATAEGLDFNQASSKDKINDWVSKATNNKIPTIVDEIPGDIMMYLINAVYFKGTWKYKFDKSATSKQAFYLRDGGSVQADFMRTSAVIRSSNQIPLVELPYGNGKYGMVILQAPAGQSLETLAVSLDAANWSQWINSLSEVKTEIALPKFKFSYKVTLNNMLKDLGMPQAFSDRADFTGINAQGHLKIDDVKHKTFVEVNEEGTEAAAVTSVGIETTTAGPAITFNRPFLFAIREMKTGLILFAGKIENPALAGD